jgi:hypothetical protein
MADIAQRGNRLTFAKGGRAGLKHGTRPHVEHQRKFKGPGKPSVSPIDQRRRNQRIQDQSKPKAYAGRTVAGDQPETAVPQKLPKPQRRSGRAAGGWTKHIPRTLKKLDFPGDRTGKPHSSREGRRDSWVRGARRAAESAKKIKEKRRLMKTGPSPQPLAKGGKADKNWIQKAVNPKHKGYCTPMTKKTCTPARKALARTFKKKAKTGW